MKQFLSASDPSDIDELITDAMDLKSKPFRPDLGKGKTLGMVFLNPSLRTRMSTQKAAMSLGMNVINLDIGKDAWKIEFEDGAVMDGGSQEHIKDAVAVMSGYVDILAIRTFAELKDRQLDYQEKVLQDFVRYSSVPIISMESATRHPLQSLADLLTIKEHNLKRPKIAVTWAPHPKALPQAVTNSFLEWSHFIDAEVVLAHPEGYGLAPEFTKGITITHQQEEALEDADFVYAKSWSSYEHYGQLPQVAGNWTVNGKKMELTKKARFMHCLPIRRNVVATDSVIDSSIVLQQAKNREYSAQAVIQQLIKELL